MISSFGLASGQGDRGGVTSTMDSVEGAAMHYRGDKGKLSDPVLRDDIARFKIDSEAFALTSRRSVEETKQGGPNATSSMLKYYGCELNKRRYELLLRSLGSQSLGWEGEGFADEELQVTREWLRSKANSIEGGTLEVQLNIIAKRVLGLPDLLSLSKK
jgi:alkylation response protein AidB-like acyl-CoA dehydrogenase